MCYFGMARRDNELDCRSRESDFFSVSAAPQHHYHSMSVIHRKKYILFRSIVFPEVLELPLNIC